jgi:hypothetical protein
MEDLMAEYQMVYSSLAGKKMLKSDLYIILRQARHNNKISGVTGLLVYTDRHFFQVLEGNKEVVSVLFEKISSDKRHSNIRILYESEVDGRSFPNWEMAYATPSARELANWAGLKNATTLEDTLNSMESENSRVTAVLSNLHKNPSLILTQ